MVTALSIAAIIGMLWKTTGHDSLVVLFRLSYTELLILHSDPISDYLLCDGPHQLAANYTKKKQLGLVS